MPGEDGRYSLWEIKNIQSSISGTQNTDEKDETLEEISGGWIREGTEASTISSGVFLKNSNDGNMKRW